MGARKSSSASGANGLVIESPEHAKTVPAVRTERTSTRRTERIHDLQNSVVRLRSISGYGRGIRRSMNELEVSIGRTKRQPKEYIRIGANVHLNALVGHT